MTPQAAEAGTPHVAKRHSIFIRCAMLMAVTTIVVAGVVTTGSLRLMFDAADASVNRSVVRSMQTGLEAVNKPLRFRVVDKIGEETANILAALGASGQVVLVIDPEGALLAASGLEGKERDELLDLAKQAAQSGKSEVGAGGRLLAEPVLAAPEGPVLGILALGATYAGQRSLTWDGARWILALAGVTFLVMSALTLVLLNRMLGRPLDQLAAAVDRVSDGNYESEPVLTHRKDEIGGIARNLATLIVVLKEGHDAETLRAERARLQLRVVEELAEALNQLAQGVLHQQITERFPEEYEGLRANYNRAITHLRDVVVEVTGGADAILGNADQIAAASNDLSQRTETQAATLEQSAAAMEEMLNAVKSAARNAAEANKTMLHTREIAERNGEVMKSAVNAMGEIEKSSDRISEITSVIDDIAFQTNLLALNAGVEAARAGESGKGFAVVASEVRGLAQRSAEAAQQIKDLILGSGEQVKHGVELVEAAGNALEDVLAKVADVSKMVSHIAASAEDQAQGLNEINEGIANLDRVTQQNAAMVEQSTAAAQMLHQEAESLSRLVGRFETTASVSKNPGPARSRAA